MKLVILWQILQVAEYSWILCQSVVVFLAELLYLRLKRILRSAKTRSNYLNAAEFERWRDAASGVVTSVSLLEPELSLNILIPIYANIVLAFVMFHYYYVTQAHLQAEKLTIYWFLKDRQISHRAIESRLDGFIESLMASNRAHIKRYNFGCPMIFRRELEEEFKFLLQLKRDKHLIWPRNRNAHWARWCRKVFVFVWLLTMAGLNSIGLPMTLMAQMASDSYRKKNSIVRESTIGRAQHPFFFSISVFIGTDYATGIASLLSVLMLDGVESMRSTEGSVIELIKSIRELRQIETCETITSASELPLQVYRFRSNTNRLALITYIRLRYSIEVARPKSMAIILNQCILVSSLTVLSTLLISLDLDAVELKTFLFQLGGILLIFNSILIICAVQYTFYLKTFRHFSTSIVASMLRPIIFSQTEDPMATSSTVTTHVSLLFKRLLESDKELRNRVAIRTLGFDELDYGGVIRINAILSYVAMFLLMYKH